MLMLMTIDHIIGMPVLSLQTGQPLAQVIEPIVNPYNLKVVALYVDGPMIEYNPAVVFTEDIRAVNSRGVVVDSNDNIMSPEGMVRLNEVIDFDFHLVKLLVVDNHGHKLGHVSGYTIEPNDFNIMQIEVRPRLMQSFTMTDMLIGRDQIVEIDNNKIVVKAPDIRVKQPHAVKTTKQMLNPEFDNPFRKPKARPAESAESR